MNQTMKQWEMKQWIRVHVAKKIKTNIFLKHMIVVSAMEFGFHLARIQFYHVINAMPFSTIHD